MRESKMPYTDEIARVENAGVIRMERQARPPNDLYQFLMQPGKGARPPKTMMGAWPDCPPPGSANVLFPPSCEPWLRY